MSIESINTYQQAIVNEVCLSIYFEQEDIDAILQSLKETLFLEIAEWTELAELEISLEGKIVQRGFSPFIIPEGFESIYMIHVRPKLSVHSNVIQFIITSYLPVELCWAKSAEWLEEKIMVKSGITERPTFIGYTIVFRTTDLSPGDDYVLDMGLLLKAKWAYNDPSSSALSVEPIGDCGYIYHLEYPDSERNGLVYLAVGHGNDPENLAEYGFVGYESLLMAMDNFVLKGTVQGIELTTSYSSLFDKQFINPLKVKIDHQLEQNVLKRFASEDNNALEMDLEELAHVYWHLERLGFSLQQQLRGLRRLFSRETPGPLAIHHLQTLAAYSEEIESVRDKNKLILETGRISVSFAQAKLTKRSTRAQESFNKILAFIGLLLAAIQIFDQPFAENVLHDSSSAVLASFPSVYWQAFFVRLITALAVTLACFALAFIFRMFRKK